jgi:hypothetical protein
LLTARETTAIPGVIPAGSFALAESLRWSVEGFRGAFAEIEREGMAKADWEAQLVWLPKAIQYNPPESPNVIKAWVKVWAELPDSELKPEIFQTLKAFVEGLGEGFQEAFREGFGKPFASPSGSPPESAPDDSRTPFREGCPNQEQEQEQEQEAFAAEPAAPPPLKLEPVPAKKTRKPSPQEQIARRLEGQRAQSLGPAALPDTYGVSRLNQMLEPLTQVAPEVLDRAHGLYLDDEYPGTRDPPWPLALFVSQWGRWVSMAAREMEAVSA